jgi:hypothetical protein
MIHEQNPQIPILSPAELEAVMDWNKVLQLVLQALLAAALPVVVVSWLGGQRPRPCPEPSMAECQAQGLDPGACVPYNGGRCPHRVSGGTTGGLDVTIKEYVTQVLEGLSEDELQQVADYLAFLKFRARVCGKPHLDPIRIGALYAESAEEDLALAEEGMVDYGTGLAAEDTR